MTADSRRALHKQVREAAYVLEAASTRWASAMWYGGDGDVDELRAVVDEYYAGALATRREQLSADLGDAGRLKMEIQTHEARLKRAAGGAQ